jgi:hypothetical protein
MQRLRQISPFRVGCLNVGYRRFRLSLEGVAALVKEQRPDILFSGEMSSSRDQLGRCRQHIEAELDDEWFLCTNTSAPPGFPVGVGAVIHCSLAQHISTAELPCPAEVKRDVWTRAVEGRLISLPPHLLNACCSIPAVHRKDPRAFRKRPRRAEDTSLWPPASDCGRRVPLLPSLTGCQAYLVKRLKIHGLRRGRR